jgi:hypothetical protein
MPSRSEIKHRQIVERFPLYEETAHWTPVQCAEVTSEAAAERQAWALARGLVRGTKESRNDYLIPVAGFWLFKDPEIAMEFKLLWG